MNNGIVLVMGASILYGMFQLFLKLSGAYVNPVLGSFLIAFVGIIGGIIALTYKGGFGELLTIDKKGLLILTLAGIIIFLVDILIIRAYNSGLNMSVLSAILIGGQIIFATFLGFIFLKEKINFAQLIGLSVTIIGVVITAYFTNN